MKLSEFQILSSGAGNYVGRLCFDSEFNCWVPYSRNTGYFSDSEFHKNQMEEIVEFLNNQPTDDESF